MKWLGLDRLITRIGVSAQLIFLSVFIFPQKIRSVWASEVPSTPAQKYRCCMPTIFPPMPIRMESLPSFSFTIDHVLANAILESLASNGGLL